MFTTDFYIIMIPLFNENKIEEYDVWKKLVINRVIM